MSSTARLFMYMAIYGTIVLLVYLACLWMIRIEERRAARRVRGGTAHGDGPGGAARGG